MMTNTPPSGAAGVGAPQTQFAIEAHMDRVAEELRIGPVRLRETNAEAGDTTATGQNSAGARPPRAARCRQALKVHAEAQEVKGTNRGIGLSLFFHGSGFTGGGEVKLAQASLELTARGAMILVEHEIGRGTRTMRANVADALGVPFDAIDVHEADTAFVPDGPPSRPAPA
jgi:CO/xanthine dehydrogenase Mo-binding subunit